MKKYIYFGLCLITILSSCSTSFKYGEYHNPRASYYITLFADSTFEYRSNATNCYIESFGRWRRQDNAIYLNSNIRKERFSMQMQKTQGNSSVSVINIDMNVPVEVKKDYICYPYWNDRLLIGYPERGSYSYSATVPIDSLRFTVYKIPLLIAGFGPKSCFHEVKTEVVTPQLAVGENLNVMINVIDSLFSYQVFNETKLKIGKNVVIFPIGKKKYKLKLKEVIH